MTKTQTQKQRARQARRKVIYTRRKTTTVNSVSRPKKQNKKKNSGRKARGITLSKCAWDYLSVLENPFSGKVACIPSTMNFPSMKHSVYGRGFFGTGTIGIGFVSVCPWSTCFNNSATSSDGFIGAGVMYTIPTYMGTTFASSLSPTPVGVGFGYTNSPYGTVVNPFDLDVRVVGCGLRIRNTTPLLSRGGTCTGIETSNHTNLTQGVSTISSDPNSGLVNISDGNWHSVVYHPADPHEYEFIPGSSRTGLHTVYPSSFYSTYMMGFIVTAPVDNPQTFDWEVYTVFEAKGGIVATATLSESDPVGLATVQNVTGTSELHRPKTGDRSGWLESVMNIPAAAGMLTSVGGAAYGLHNVYARSQPRPNWSQL